MLQRTDKKKPTGDSTLPAGRTDSTMVPASSRARKIGAAIKHVALYLAAATLVTACFELVTANAINCAEVACDL